jgi:hypothetical protein
MVPHPLLLPAGYFSWYLWTFERTRRHLWLDSLLSARSARTGSSIFCGQINDEERLKLLQQADQREACSHLWAARSAQNSLIRLQIKLKIYLFSNDLSSEFFLQCSSRPFFPLAAYSHGRQLRLTEVVEIFIELAPRKIDFFKSSKSVGKSPVITPAPTP